MALFVSLTTAIAVVGLTAGTAFADINGCPNLGDRPTSNLVGAHVTTSGNDATYFFDSLTDESPSSGVPGLIAYCVYPAVVPTGADGSVTVVAQGDDGGSWQDPPLADNFSFERTGGNDNNIGLDGNTDEMGTATWTAGIPTAFDTILLHINDAAECASLGEASDTCFVLPGSAPSAEDLTVSKNADTSFTRTFGWDISKDVDATEIDIADGGQATFNYTVNVTHDSGSDSDFVASGDITVSNPNAFDVSGVDVTDAVDNGGSCSVTAGTGLNVPANGSTVVSYSCTYSSLPSDGTNTGTATWPDIGSPNTSASGTANVHFGDPTLVNKCVNVTDTLGGDLGQVCSSDPSPTSFQYPHNFDGVGGTCTDYDNTATITETGQTASKTVTVCVGLDLTVSKGATPSFKRTFHWGITKDVDKTSVKQAGGTATFNYTVKVTHDSGTDSDWAVKGTITVTNPNDWEAITFDLADAIDNGGSCSIDGGGSGLSVPASDTKTADYTCTYSSAPSPAAGTNTATATWDASAYSTPTGSADGTHGFDFANASPDLIDECVNVTDSYAGTLGTACNTDPSPKSFTYSRTVNVPAFGCVSYSNTATFTTNDSGATGSADKTVTVCGPAKTGALTMGYWQNKNGQGIIKAGSSTGGVCNSGTWLRQYAPFQDLSATATCTQVATYVTNVIKAANASGASMNAMLKAQMLATALDVYFSDPALGGNKINAPAPIGGVAIDLTKICKMIDSAGGSATCSGTYQNASGAFGGATSLTVSQILAYAASQSNVGGSTWYGQVKATQELAKNTFDAINNQVAFAP